MGIMSVWSIPILKKKEKEKKVFSYFLLLMSIVQLHLNSTHPLWKISKTSNAVGVWISSRYFHMALINKKFTPSVINPI